MRCEAQWYVDDAYAHKLPDGRWIYKFFRVYGEITHTYYCYDEIDTGPCEDTETFSRAFWNPEELPDSVVPIKDCWAFVFADQLKWLEQHDYPIMVEFTVHIEE
jgi:hypothetical protein